MVDCLHGLQLYLWVHFVLPHLHITSSLPVCLVAWLPWSVELIPGTEPYAYLIIFYNCKWPHPLNKSSFHVSHMASPSVIEYLLINSVTNPWLSGLSMCSAKEHFFFLPDVALRPGSGGAKVSIGYAPGKRECPSCSFHLSSFSLGFRCKHNSCSHHVTLRKDNKPA